MGRVVGLLMVVAALIASTVTHAADVSFNGYRFTLPEGFRLELAAGPPLVDRPICIDFDEAGRLYVAESSGSNDPVQQQLAERPHRILRLADSDGDGRFDTRTVFADRMMFPEGAMWLDGSLYVSAPPSIWKLTDTDGDGIADQREEWFNGQTLTGCANDLHGPYRGSDGWIYWCKGAFAEQTHERAGRSPLVTRAAHIFRRRPEGGPVEAVMTGGMDNPVDVVFTPGGERIFTTTFLEHPGGGRRDGLIHAIYGGVYGKPHGVLDGHSRTGDLMPALVHLGAAAPCGLECMQSDAWGAEYHGNLFAALFNMRKVTRHVLEPAGATFTTRDEDFLVCDSLDFHPTDVIEDADGSLLVVDTGGWYKLCCPTSQLRKPDVLGGIYRVRRESAQTPDDPRGLQLDWSRSSVESLIERLTDDRPAVRRRAAEQLSELGATAVEALGRLAAEGQSPAHRLAAVWTLARIEGDQARAEVRRALNDLDRDVRQAAIHAVSIWRDGNALSALIKLLDAESPHNQRAAAEALGRLSSAEAVQAILAAATGAEDRVAEHSLIHALIEINDPKATAAGLASDDSAVQRAALVALDQMEASALDAGEVVGRLDSPDPKLRETALWIVERHPDWAPQMVGYFMHSLTNDNPAADTQADLTRLLSIFAGHEDVQRLMAGVVAPPEVSPAVQMLVLRAMAGARLKAMPAMWAAPLAGMLDHENPDVARSALAAAAALAPPEDSADLSEALHRLGRNGRLPIAWRLEALSAVPGGLTKVDDETFALLVEHIGANEEVNIRSRAADTLAAARLTPEQLDQLAERIVDIGPLELERVLAAIARGPDDELGQKLLARLKVAPALASLPRDKLRACFAPFGPTVQEGLDRLCTQLDEATQDQREQLDERLASLSAGDVRRGQLVFNSERAACSACHAIGYLGGTIGPDLTRIGGIRSELDLLESLLLPSASFVRSYEPVIVETVDGRVFNGLLHESSADQIVITTSERKQIYVARADIEQIQPGTVSVMPTGLDQQLTSQELADLLAFLKAAR